MPKKSKKKPTVFCPAPFNSVTVVATGRWALCCESKAEYSHPGGHRNIKQSLTVDEWFNGDYMKAVRESMLAGKPLKECGSCYRAEELGNRSLRDRLSEGSVPWDTENPRIEHIDIKFGNKCNLKCKMCFPHSSSELTKEWRALGWDTSDPMEGQRKTYYDGYLLEDYNWPRDRGNIDKLLAVARTVKHLKFTGGEPMINPQMFAFMRHCVDQGLADSIELSVTTNCTKIHPGFLELARAFRRLNLTMSVDGMGATYDYIRYPAHWPSVERNIRRYAQWYRDGDVRGAIGINCTLSVFNLHQVTELHRFALELGVSINIYDMTHPPFMTWRHAPKHVHRQAVRSAMSLVNDADTLVSHCGKLVCAILARENVVPSEASRALLARFQSQQDRLRGIQIQDYIPHLANIYGDQA
jgi:hypothetical protein